MLGNCALVLLHSLHHKECLGDLIIFIVASMEISPCLRLNSHEPWLDVYWKMSPKERDGEID